MGRGLHEGHQIFQFTRFSPIRKRWPKRNKQNTRHLDKYGHILFGPPPPMSNGQKPLRKSTVGFCGHQTFSNLTIPQLGVCGSSFGWLARGGGLVGGGGYKCVVVSFKTPLLGFRRNRRHLTLAEHTLGIKGFRRTKQLIVDMSRVCGFCS